MPPSKTPVETPVTFSFNSGRVQLTSVFDPETACSQVIKLISQHRDSVKCKRKSFNESKLDSKNWNLVSQAILIILCSGSDELMSGW